MTYREKFALLDKENKSPIEEVFTKYYLLFHISDVFKEYDRRKMTKENLFYKWGINMKYYWKAEDLEVINKYKKDDDIKEFCIRIYNLFRFIKNSKDIEKIRNLYINACYEDYNYIVRKQKRIKFRKTIKRKRGR